MTRGFSDQEETSAFYAQLLERHGAGPRAVGWNTSHGQLAGFLQLVRLDGFGSGVRVLDLGCGLGDLVGFLAARDIDVDYTGWDICEPLIDAARARYPGARFAVRDILAEAPRERFDFVLCSGALNLVLPDHEAWLARMVGAMFRLCTRGLAFNLLSAHYAHDNPFSVEPERYHYADPAAAFALCTGLSRQVVVEHYGQAGTFTAFVYRRSLAPMRRLHEAIAPGPDYGPAHQPIIELYESHGFREELIEYLEGLNPSAALFDRIGVVASVLEDEAREREAFERAIELDSESASSLVHLAIHHLEHERAQEALPLLERAAELEPNDERARHWLMRCREML